MPLCYIDDGFCDCSFGFRMFDLNAYGSHTVLFVTFQDRIGCKEGDTIVRSIAEFEVPDVLVCSVV